MCTGACAVKEAALRPDELYAVKFPADCPISIISLRDGQKLLVVKKPPEVKPAVDAKAQLSQY